MLRTCRRYFGACCRRFCGSGRVLERTFASIWSLLAPFLLFSLLLNRFGANFLPFWNAQTTEKPRISLRGSSKSRFSLYSRRVPRWASLGGCLASLGGLSATFCVSLGASWDPLGGILGTSWGLPGAFLGVSWGFLGEFCVQGPPKSLLGASWGLREAS